MSHTNAFLDVLSHRSAPAVDPRGPALQVLERFRVAVEQVYGQRVSCRVAPGYPTNYGQEYRLVVRSTSSGYEHTLFRAYIPAVGTNIRVDTYAYEMVVCVDAAALEEHLLAFLRLPSTLDALDTYAK